MTAAIVCDRLTKRYGAARGIDDLTLSVEEGEVFGFLGPNGAGKSTTIRILLDLQRATSGSAQVLGLDSRRDSARIRARTGNLPGDFSLDPRLTGRQALRFHAALRGVPDVRGADELVRRFGAELDRPLGELSRGNRQKVGLVLALFHDPDLLILDEPTGGLDPLMQAEFLAVVAERRAAGRTVFLSSHDLDEVQRACDRVAVVRDGRLVAVEEVDRLRRRAYRNVAVRVGVRVDPDVLGGIPGVEGLDTDVAAQTVRFRVRGPIAPVVRALAGMPVEDLEVTRPSLDELVLDLYREPVA